LDADHPRNLESFARCFTIHAWRQVVFIPLSLIEELANQDQDGDDGVELAFTKQTTMDCMHIISYTLDEHYNQDGELVES
jgi:hypothetical protein